MSIFNRLFTWGKSEANAAIDQIEDPVKMAEQGIRDLRKDLSKAMEALAQVKAQSIRTKREGQRYRDEASDYERKAMMLVQRGQSGEMDGGEADRLASEALAKRDSAVERATTMANEIGKLDGMTGQMETNVQNLKSQIAKWENEVRTLKARAQVSQATRKLNQQLANVDSTGTISMLERMRDKVQTEESLAEAYGEMASVETSVDVEIDAALAATNSPSTSTAALEDLKARMGQPKAIPLGNSAELLPRK